MSSLLVPLLGQASGWGAGATGVAQAAGSIGAALVVSRTGTARRTGRAVALGLAAASGGVALVATAGGGALGQRCRLQGQAATPIDAVYPDYPDYRAILAVHGSRSTRAQPSSIPAGITVTAPDLLEQVTRDEARSGPAGPRTDLVRLGLDPTELRIGDEPGTVAFDREYLADAVRSFGDADLLLTVGERDALRLAGAHGPDAVVLLMPVRPEAA